MNAGFALVLSLVAREGQAQPAGAKLDLYDGIVLGSPRIIGMGGSVTAAAEDMTGTLTTAAAMAFRPPGSDPDRWDWDIYLDAFRATRATDLSNSGLPAYDGVAIEASSGGLALYFGRWGFAVATTGVTYALPAATDAMGMRNPVELSRQSSQFTTGRAWLDDQLGVGLALVVDEFLINESTGPDRAALTLFNLTRVSLSPGVTYRPAGRPFRLGIATRLPAVGGATTNECEARMGACNGFAPPTGATAPWQVGLGFAWRISDGSRAWNLAST
ncbi:MAG TPA: hypothetical protein VGF45_00710, partial [Polyangia bacterium]